MSELMSMEITDILAKKKKCFMDGSYYYSSSIGLYFKNKEAISLSLFKQCALLKGAIFNTLYLLLNGVASNVFSYACLTSSI